MRNVFFQIILTFCFFLIIFVGIGFAQPTGKPIFEITKSDTKPDTPIFGLQMYNFASEESKELSNLYVQLNFPFSNLQFIRNRESKDKSKSFRADFQTTVTIMDDSTGEEIEFLRWKGNIFAKTYKETKLEDKYGYTRNAVDLSPGKYNFKVEFKDLETTRVCEVAGIVRVTGFFNQGFTVSTMLFVNSIDFIGSEPKDESVGLYAYYEVYNIPEGDTARVKYKIVSSDGKINDGKVESFVSTGLINKKYVPISEQTLPSDFNVELTVYYNNDSLLVSSLLAPQEKNKGAVYEKLEDSIEQMLYVAGKKEVEKMLKLEGEEQLNYFNAFWKKKDPSPESSVNEYMNEYYRRVYFANERFKSLIPGWKTQMGMVFIKLGQPSYIDKPMGDAIFEPNYGLYGQRKQIVWLYHNYNRRVIFELFGSDYRISNYNEIFDLLSDDGIRF